MKYNRTKRTGIIAAMLAVGVTGMAYHRNTVTPRPGKNLVYAFAEGCGNITSVAISSDYRWAIIVQFNVHTASDSPGHFVVDLSKKDHRKSVMLLEATTSFSNQHFCVADSSNMARYSRAWSANNGILTIDVIDPPSRAPTDKLYGATISLSQLKFRLTDTIFPISTTIDDVQFNCTGFGWYPE